MRHEEIMRKINDYLEGKDLPNPELLRHLKASLLYGRAATKVEWHASGSAVTVLPGTAVMPATEADQIKQLERMWGEE